MKISQNTVLSGIIIIIVVIGILFFASRSQQSARYVCPDGSVVSDINSCAKKSIDFEITNVDWEEKFPINPNGSCLASNKPLDTVVISTLCKTDKEVSCKVYADGSLLPWVLSNIVVNKCGIFKGFLNYDADHTLKVCCSYTTNGQGYSEQNELCKTTTIAKRCSPI